MLIELLCFGYKEWAAWVVKSPHIEHRLLPVRLWNAVVKSSHSSI